MDEAFEKLKKEGKNDVNNLIKWMQDSKVIDEAKATEDKARALFNDAADKNKIELEKFKEALAKLAEEQKKNMDDFAKVLAEKGSVFLNAVQAGASAFTEALTKK